MSIKQRPALCRHGRALPQKRPLQHRVCPPSAVTQRTPTYLCFSESSNSFSVLLFRLWDEGRPRDAASFTSLIASSGQLVCFAQFKNSSITWSLQKQRPRVTLQGAPSEVAIDWQRGDEVTDFHIAQPAQFCSCHSREIPPQLSPRTRVVRLGAPIPAERSTSPCPEPEGSCSPLRVRSHLADSLAGSPPPDGPQIRPSPPLGGWRR